MVIVACDNPTPRVLYALEIILTRLLGLNFNMVQVKSYCADNTQPVLNYSSRPIEGSLQIIPHRLMYENEISKQQIEIEQLKALPCFFRTAPSGDIPFDLVACSFYLLSRYEEYLPFTPDRHGRFEASESLAFRHGFLKTAIVNRWAALLADELRSKFPWLQIADNQYSFTPTFDIDNTFAYRHKGLARTLIALARAVSKGGMHELRRVVDILRLKADDPFDTYNFIRLTIRDRGLTPYFFLPVASYSRYEKNCPPHKKVYHKLIHDLASWAEIGLHPSYRSATQEKRLKKEIKTWERICGKPLKISRQHYLMLRFPDTLRMLVNQKTEADFTLGYASQTGFRAGIATPYPFFDLKENQVTSLILWPFQLMDSSLRHYLMLSPEQAVEEIRKIVAEVKAVGGTFVSLWHNDSLSETGAWKGYRQVYETMLELARPE